MSEDWDFYLARVDDQPASIYVDLGIASEAPLESHGLLGYVRVEMRAPSDDGLSTDEEFETLIAIEDALVAALRQIGAIFVGRNTSSGQRDFYFYLSDPKAFEFAADSALHAYPEYRWITGTRPDPEWRAYFDFLRPSERDRQRILNRRVREALQEKGDCLTATRDIDHVVYLPEEAARHAFVSRASDRGYAVVSEGPTEDGEEYANIVRQDRPSEIDEIVLQLVEICAELGGRYDGWGCEVTEGREPGTTLH